MKGSKKTKKVEAEPYLDNYRSAATQKHYERALEQFEKYSRINLRKAKAVEIKKKLIDYVTHLRKSGKSYSKQNIVISAVQKWCTVKDIDGINFKSIRTNFAGDSDEITVQDTPYTKEQLRQILELANPRLKALILLMVSSGVRVGAIPGMKIGDITKLEEYPIYQVSVYPDSKKHRYTTFATPEAAKAIDDYLHTREIKGEVLKPESPLFRREFDSDKANKDILPLTVASIFKLVSQVAVNAGVRILKKGTTERHQTPLLHSFRKIANTGFVQADIPEIKREMLLGHATGLQGRYTRIEDKERDLAREYVKSIPHLTVSNTKALQLEVEQLKTKTADLDTLKKAYMDQKLNYEQLKKDVEDYKKRTDKEMYDFMMNRHKEGDVRHPNELNAIAAEMAPKLFESLYKAIKSGVTPEEFQEGIMKRLKEKIEQKYD